MKIDLHNIKVSELVADYADKQEEGVRGYGGKLNIHPANQRDLPRPNGPEDCSEGRRPGSIR